MTSENSLFYLFNDMKAEYLGSKEYEFESRHFYNFMNHGKSRGYKLFTIPKKAGGARRIWAPKGNLKWIQYCIKEIIEALYEPNTCVYGFVKGKAITDNAKCHTGKNYVFNIDLSSFFESVTEKMVANRLSRAPFLLNQQISNTIARLSCVRLHDWIENPETHVFESYSRYVLAQGSPTSPVLANAVCDDMDIMLSGLASRFGLTYTRYADDITFSSNHNVYYSGSEFRKELLRIVSLFGFEINKKKTRLQHRIEKQEVTGLTVNSGTNINRKWYKELRGLLHIWSKFGKNAALNSFYPRYHSSHGKPGAGVPNLENIVYGKLCFLKMVIGEDNPRFTKLSQQFNALTNQPHEQEPSETWQYLYTMPLKAFERIFHTKVEYRSSKLLTVLHAKGRYEGDETPEEIKALPTRHFGYFTYNGVSFLVALSGKLQNLQIPYDAEISLCKTNSRGCKYIYLVHRRHSTIQYKLPAIKKKAPPIKDKPLATEEIPSELLAIAEKMKAMFPELKLEIVGVEK